MGGRRQNGVVASLLISIFLFSLLSPLVGPVEESELNVEFTSPSIGQTSTVSIGSYPDGVNDATSISVPSGEAISGIELSLDESVLPVSAAKMFDSPAAYDHSMAVYDGMDVNNSVLQLLPQGWTYDMEGTNLFTFSGNNVWFWGYDSSIGQANGVTSGTKAIYTYNGNYPNGMSTTYWATSPVMNCGGCSGGWDLKFQKRLGVESSTWDRAYVSVKNTAGNWVNVWSNSGTVNDGQYTTQTITISNYIAGNTNFQVRFGLGTSDGSVTYTGWNIDDVEILPKASGISTGEGNWTSAPFGPGATLGSEPSSYGLLAIDAEIPTGALFEWTLIDASTGTPEPRARAASSPSVVSGTPATIVLPEPSASITAPIPSPAWSSAAPMPPCRPACRSIFPTVDPLRGPFRPDFEASDPRLGYSPHIGLLQLFRQCACTVGVHTSASRRAGLFRGALPRFVKRMISVFRFVRGTSSFNPE